MTLNDVQLGEVAPLAQVNKFLKVVQTLTCGRFRTRPAHEVGFTHCRLCSGRLPPKPPDTNGVVVRAGSNLPTEQWWLHTVWVQHPDSAQHLCLCAGFTKRKQNRNDHLTLWLYLGEICGTPHDRGHFLTVALKHHGRMLRVGNLKIEYIFF